MQDAVHGIGPAGDRRLDSRAFGRRVEDRFGLPLPTDLVEILPVAHGKARQVGRAQRRGLRHARADDLRAQQVGLELHQQVVARSPAVDLQLPDRNARVALHGPDDVVGLERDALERRTRDMRRRRPAADAADRTPGILVPPGSGQARERRNEVDPARVGNRGGKGLDLRRGADDPQAVAQPLHDRTPDEDASLEGVVHLPADLPRHSGQQVVLRKDRTLPAVHQQEATRAVGIFHRAGFGAHLSEKRRLLVARNARDGDLVGEDRRLRRAVDLARRFHLWHHRPRNVEEFQQVVVPLQRVDVEEHRARSVAHVGHVHVSARQAPDEPRVDRPEEEFALLGARTRPRNVVENPLDLRRAEVCVDDQARFRTDVFRLALGLQAVAVLRSPAVLPHNGIVDRLLGLHVPDDGRLSTSQTMVVSRWFVMPMPAMLSPLMSIEVIASAITEACEAQISCGLCSTHPGLGKYWVNSRWAIERICPVRSKMMARELLVPWSRDKMYWSISLVFRRLNPFSPRGEQVLSEGFGIGFIQS